MFKVGQLVWCKKEHYYGVTDYHVKCEVIRVFEAENTIRVKVAEGEWCSEDCPGRASERGRPCR